MSAEWRPIVGYEGRYEASSDGDIRRIGSATNLRPSPGRTGYGRVTLYVEGSRRGRVKLSHRLICTAFHGPRPAGKQVAHLDGVKLNNAPSNLAWKTAKENCADRVRHGTDPKGHRNGVKYYNSPRGESSASSVLTEAAVFAIRHAFRRGCLYREISQRFGIAVSSVASIVYRRTWTHI